MSQIFFTDKNKNKTMLKYKSLIHKKKNTGEIFVIDT